MKDTDTFELTIDFAATELTSETCLTYRAGAYGKIVEAFAQVAGRKHPTKPTASILELAFRYRQKQASSATLSTGGITFRDSVGNGCVDPPSGEQQSEREMWRILAGRIGMGSSIEREIGPQYLYDLVRDLSSEQARQHSFIATCGSTAADVHVLRGHSVLWASVPPGGRPNEIHRHLGGSVYCLFYRGRGLFHRVDPVRRFETLPIDTECANTFQMIAIPTHLWYQPVNTGTEPLEYFMIHEPGFDASELLVLEREECGGDWLFEF